MNNENNQDSSSPWAQDADAPVHEHRKEEVDQQVQKDVFDELKTALGQAFGSQNVQMYRMSDLDQVEKLPPFQPGTKDYELSQKIDADGKSLCEYFAGDEHKKIEMFILGYTNHSIAHALSDNLTAFKSEELCNETREHLINLYPDEADKQKKVRITIEVVE